MALYDNIAYGESLGTTAKFPRNAMAFKWADEQAETTLREVEELLETACAMVALDMTDRPRPGGVAAASLVQRIHEGDTSCPDFRF